MKHYKNIMDTISNPDTSIEEKNTLIAIYISQIAVMISSVIGTVLALNPYLLVLSYVMVVQTPMIFFIVSLCKQDKYLYIAKYISLGLFILELPLLYCFSGGYHGPGITWFIFSFLLSSVIFPKRISLIAMSFNLFVIIATLIVTSLYPDLLISLEPSKSNVNSFLCAMVACLSIAHIMLMQKEIAQSAYRHLKEIENETAHNNTELIALTQELNHSVLEKEKSLEQQQRFTAMLNHELRQPLNGIMGFLQLRLLADIPEQYKKDIRESYALTEMMLQTVNDILDFSKMQAGKFEITMDDFKLDELIHNIHTLFDEQAKKKGLQIIYNVPLNNYNLHSDNIRIQQILSNLLSNSVKYTDCGTISVDIRIDDSNLIFSVSDTGKGMSEEEVACIFDPYKRFDVENNAKIQGTGLGMSIVQNLTNQLHGAVSVTSTPGVGTKFRVSIPVIVNKIETASFHKEDTTAVYDLSNKVFLIVDDNAINLKVLEMFLRRANATVIKAKNGIDALNVIHSNKVEIDLIITDNLMPEMDGCEMKRVLNEERSRIPAIIITGSTDKDSLIEFHALQFSSVMEKPVLYEPLMDTICSVLHIS